MEIIEQIVGAIILVSVFLLVGIVVMTSYTQQSVQEMGVEQQAILDRRYSEDLNSLMLVTENTSRRTMGELIGTLITEDIKEQGKETIMFGDNEIEVQKELKKILDATYGKDNYYLEIKPDLKDLAVFFIFDGSSSMELARESLAVMLPGMIDEFKNLGKEIISEVIILTSKESKCNIFRNQSIDCSILGYDDLYDSSTSPFISTETVIFEDDFDSDSLIDNWYVTKGAPEISRSYIDITPDDSIITKRSFTFDEFRDIFINFSLIQHYNPSTGHGFYIKLVNNEDADKFITFDVNYTSGSFMGFSTFENFTRGYPVYQSQDGNNFNEQGNWVYYNCYQKLQNLGYLARNEFGTLKITNTGTRLIATFSFFYGEGTSNRKEYTLYNLTFPVQEESFEIEIGFNDEVISGEAISFHEHTKARIYDLKIETESLGSDTQLVTGREFEDFFAADWGAAIEYVSGKKTDITAGLNIIFTVSDELSTSSLADSYYTYKDSGIYIDAAYEQYYALCDDSCPIDRSNRSVMRAIEAAKSNNVLVYPIFAYNCDFKYAGYRGDQLEQYFQGLFGLSLPENQTYCNKTTEELSLMNTH